jgi:hypothetical protein
MVKDVHFHNKNKSNHGNSCYGHQLYPACSDRFCRVSLSTYPALGVIGPENLSYSKVKLPNGLLRRYQFISGEKENKNTRRPEKKINDRERDTLDTLALASTGLCETTFLYLPNNNTYIPSSDSRLTLHGRNAAVLLENAGRESQQQSFKGAPAGIERVVGVRRNESDPQPGEWE